MLTYMMLLEELGASRSGVSSRRIANRYGAAIEDVVEAIDHLHTRGIVLAGNLPPPCRCASSERIVWVLRFASTERAIDEALTIGIDLDTLVG